MKRKALVGLIIVTVVTVAFLLGTVYLFTEACRCNRQFDQWVTAEPVRMKVDLSKPGTFIGKFHQTCQSAHGQYLYIEPAGKEESENLFALLQDVDATIRITDVDGDEVLKTGLDLDSDGMGNIEPDHLGVAYFYPFPKGGYTLTLTVHKGTEASDASDVALVGRYALCGLEGFSVVILTVAGIVSLCITVPAVIGVCVGWALAARKRAASRGPM